MKKIISLTLFCALIALSVMSAAAYNTKTAEIAYGTPAAIDGVKDAAWDNAKMIVADQVNQSLIPSSTKTVGKVWTLWDENYLYIYAEVTKSVVNSSDSRGEEEVDSIEFGIDFMNTSGSVNMIAGGDKTAGVVRIGTNDSQISGFGFSLDRNDYEKVINVVKGKCIITDYGYCAELAIPWIGLTAAPAAGAKISMEVQINVNDGGNGRDGLVTWNDIACMGWQDSAAHGELTLLAAPVVEVPVPSDDHEDTPTVPQKPVTGDTWIYIFGMFAIVSAAGIVVFKKRRCN